jgi:hypothetical protein
LKKLKGFGVKLAEARIQVKNQIVNAFAKVGVGVFKSTAEQRQVE